METQQLLITAVESFRVGREAQGSEALMGLMDRLDPLLKHHAATLTSIDVALVNAIVKAQARGDFIYVADLLEYELPQCKLGELLALCE